MTADTVGGVWTYACELIGALAPLGVEVTLATMGAPLSRAQVETAARLDNLDVVERRFALEWMPSPWADVDAAGAWLLELADDLHPDVVHVNGYAHAALPFVAPVIVVAHSCVASWFRAVRGHDAPASWDEYRRRVVRGLASADVVVAPTAAILRDVLAAYAPALPATVRARARVIPNGRDPRGFVPAAKEPFVLAAGRMWDEAKGLATLAACADRVPWPVRIAGPTVPPAGIAVPPPAGVELLGELSPAELADQLARAAIYALPARYEPFGLSILEAALAGCALVVGDLDSLRELWGNAAVYVDPRDPAALTIAVRALANDPEGRAELAARARARGLALSPARMAAAYRALYDQPVAPRAARPARTADEVRA